MAQAIRLRSGIFPRPAAGKRYAGHGAGTGLALLAVAATVCALRLSAQDPVIRVNVNLVPITATVRNRAGQLVGALRKEDFQISDNGVRQEIAVFERQTEQPLSVALLIDVSGSTAKDLKYEIDSASRFIRVLLTQGNPKDQVALYAFDDEVWLVNNFTHSSSLLEASLKRIHGTAGTSLYDAIWLAATEGLETREGRKVMVIVSDGGNTTSSKDSHQALQAAQLANAVIYPVVDMPITNDAGRNVGGENALTFMAEGTGGRTFFPSSGAQLDKAFDEIIAELRTAYLIGFYPHDVPPAKDRFHRLTVRVQPPELQVSARNGYYGGAETFSGSPDDRVLVKPESKSPKKR
jgi:Ca-activated chloride channel homolog